MSTRTIERIQTARLTCERLRPQHATELLPLDLDPRVARTLWPDSEPPTETDVLQRLAGKLEHWERYGFGLWFVRDRVTGAMLGRGGLQHTYVEGVHDIEAGWAIVPERWGEGLATELAFAAVEVAFEDLGLPWIVAFTLPSNVASRRVMEKAGFRYQRDIVHAGLPHVLYRRSAGEEAG